jgi:DNA invertase Pin-like site-specific DNA recombinase
MKGMETPAVRCALYARVSTKDKGQDTENQLVQLRLFCKAQGWTLAHEYVDHATGKNSDRPEFKRLFQDASQAKFNMVLFWSLDRFSREGVLETLNHLNKLTAAKVNWRSLNEQYLDSCGIFKDAVLSILAVVAKQERIRISERTLAGLETARSKGKTLGRPKLVRSHSKIIAAMAQDGATLRSVGKRFALSAASVQRIVKQAQPVTAR